MGHTLQSLRVLSVFLACITLIEAEECSINPCQNGGTCELAILEPGYVCLCSKQWIGQHCDFESMSSPATCGQTYFDTTGLLKSPNWPERAGRNELCIYSIRIPTATTIFIQLNSFMSEFRKDDLFYTTGPYIDIKDPSNCGFNGNKTRPETYSYDTNQMTFGWKSDHTIKSKGFNITYSIASKPCINEPCRNGATCLPSGISYTCQICSMQNGEEFCERVSKPCINEPCRNGATCLPSGISYTCQICSVQDGEEFCERGVEIVSTRLAIDSGGTLREGYLYQKIGFAITMSPRVTAGSVSGSNLWQVTIFVSANRNGVGTRVGETQVNPNQFHAGADVILGHDTVLQVISAQWKLNWGTTCAEIPYFCALVEKSDNPSPDFFLSEPPQVACQPITCRGVEVIGTSILVHKDYPIVERRRQHPVTFDLTIATDPGGGRVIGNNLWAVSFYYSTSDIPGNGVSSPSSLVVLNPFQSGTDIVSPGVPTTLEGLSGTLNLSSAVCTNAQYVCAILSRNPSSDPLFSLSPTPGSDESVMESCYLVRCQDACMFDNPCQNEGTCMDDEDNPGNVKCVCQDGYRGLYCGESTPWLLIAALVGGLAVFTLLLVILIISCAKAKNRSSARNEPDVSNLLFLVGRAMAVMSNSRRQRPALKVDHPDPEAVADEPNVGVDMNPENRGQENMGPPNRPPPRVPRRSLHLYASRVVGLFRTTTNREEQH